MSEPQQDIIQPQSAPLTHLNARSTARDNRLDWRSAAVGVIVIAVLLLAWLVRPAPTALPPVAAERSALAPTGRASGAAQTQPAPFAQTQLQRAREQAQTELASFVEKQIQLEESMSVAAWGDDDLTAALALAQAGDQAFVAEKYDLALASYQQAVAALDTLISRGDAEFDQAVTATLHALGQFDPEGAAVELARAKLIKPDHPAIAALDQRVANLPDVIVMLRTAKNHEFSGRFDKAIDLYDQIAVLDPATVGLAQLRAAAVQAQAGDNLTALISAGFHALQDQRFDDARTAFNKALQQDPGNDIAAGGLQQVAEQHDLAVIARHRRDAEKALAAEEWQAAVDQYQAALKLDGNLQFALSGIRLAQSHLRAEDLLSRIVNAPERLSNESLYLEAGTILGDAKQLERAGPKLNALIAEVAGLLKLYRDPVEVVLISDDATDVIVSNVGRIGRFERTTLSLRPGQYTIRGSQNGCQDIYLSVEVLPGIEPLDLRCPQRLTQ